MRIIALCLAGCIAIAALRLAIALAAIFAIGALLWLVYFKPLEALCFVAFCMTLRLVESHPLLVAGTVVAVAMTARNSDIDSTKP
ncbi:hypothetical protein [Sphingorhabdus sp.]|uniref:hypothetical protein n=1 Tax=Sphingorhabdus sp. TaxID=1902408 RepID=UPI0035AEB260